MSDTYKLVFRGEVLEGQHPAVVRKRLAETAGFSEEQLDQLFSGKPVAVKRVADTATAARFQALFKKAGARLRVLPVETEDDAVAAMPEGNDAPAAPDTGFELLPVGSDLLNEDERPRVEAREVDTSSLALEVPAPVDSAHRGQEAAPTTLEPPAFDVAEVGADLAPAAAPVRPVIDVAAVSFEVAPAGADLAPRKPAPPPPPPDTSHLSLE